MSPTKQQLFNQIEAVPEQLIPSLMRIVQEFVGLIPSHTATVVSTEPVLGHWAGQYTTPDNFNDTLDDFEEYL